MKNRIIVTILGLLLGTNPLMAQSQLAYENSTLDGVKKWFSAWELVCQDIYRVDKYTPVEFVFFDDEFVYSTSAVTIPNGETVTGPSVFQTELSWKRMKHNDQITLPDKKNVPVGLMSFAAPLSDDTSFFVMPLPSFWKKAGVKSNETSLENLVTGVFIHEFSHSQQMQNFGRKMTEYELKYKFDVEFTDDIVQDLFEKNKVFDSLVRKEIETFYTAAGSDSDSAFQRLTLKALEMFKQRRATYLTGKNEILKEVEEFFLTMEGFGQYSMYAWLIHPKGANIPETDAVRAVRRGGRFWSQDEGLALFLVLSRLVNPEIFGESMLGSDTESVLHLIRDKQKFKN